MSTGLLVDARARRLAAFTAVAVAVGVGDGALLAHLTGLAHPGAVASGAAIDFAIVVPAAYYWLVVRPGAAPPLSLVAVIAVSLLAASRLIPPGQQTALRVIEAAAGAGELALLAWLARRAAAMLRQRPAGHATDGVERLTAAVHAVVGRSRLADILAYEACLLYYALGTWRAVPDVPDGAVALSQYRRSGYGLLVLAVVHATVVEGIVAHVLLARWSAPAAWVVTALGGYGLLWLVADYRATRLRPSLIIGGRLVVRAGLRWQGTVAIADLAGMTRDRGVPGRHAARLVFPARPLGWLQLARPMELRGPYGHRRLVRALGVLPDDPAALAALAEAGARPLR